MSKNLATQIVFVAVFAGLGGFAGSMAEEGQHIPRHTGGLLTAAGVVVGFATWWVVVMRKK